MSSESNGGAAFPCARCDAVATHKQGHQWLCPKHYRFGQMIANANRRGLQAPSHGQLADMLCPEMRCPDCKVVMNWLARDGQAHVVTLQHYRDGSFGLVCRSCNTRHAFAPGDSFREHPADHKYCPQCQEFLPLNKFCSDNSRSGPLKVKSWCRSCSRDAHAAWRSRKADAMIAAREVKHG